MSSVGPVRKVAPPLSEAQVAVTAEEGGGYVLGQLLTQGGMASVYLGKRVAPGGFEKTLVLKRLRPELASKPELLALFLREASLSAILDHPSIVRTFDLTRIDGAYYLVMEYVHGGDLRLLLRRARRRGQHFSAAAALLLGRELLAALEYAHSRCGSDGRPLELSHRDVSPANILLSSEGEVKLSDFGIAQGSAESDAGGVRLRGKVGYMSPEQAYGARVDARSDLFALAAVLYEVLTGKRLFIGQPGQPVAEIYSAPIIPPSTLCPELPAACDALLRKALTHRPEGRYQTAREFYEALVDLTRDAKLWLDRHGLAEHLREICGPDPGSWRALDERTGTALIPSVGEGDEPVDPGDSAEHSPLPLRTYAEHSVDPMITVPWPTVPVHDKELVPPPASSPDITMPVPSAELTDIHLSLAHDAITSPAPLLEPLQASTEPALPPPLPSAAGEHAPGLSTAELLATGPRHPFPTLPTRKVPLTRRYRDLLLLPLLGSGGGSCIGLFLLGVGGVLLTLQLLSAAGVLTFSFAQAWSWLGEHLAP